MKRIPITCLIAIALIANVHAQERMHLDEILSVIQKNHPVAKMYDAEINAMDAAAGGARSWMPPELGAGFFMTPYDIRKTKAMGAEKGMGSFMISAQQMFPNKKEQDANAKYMEAMSSVSKETREATLNELYATAKKSYYAWLIIKKKLKVLGENERLLNFMIQSAELRYKNNLGKINAYYKAKAALGNIENQRVAMHNEIQQQQVLLNTLMNRDKNQYFDIDTSYAFKDYNMVDSTYFLQARSDIKAIEKDIQLNDLKINLEKSKLLPQFGIRYDHMFAFGQQPWLFTLMAMIKIPLVPWASKMYRANIESYKWKSKAFEQQKQMLLNDATGGMQGMLYAIKNKRKQVSLYEQNIIPALQKNYQTMQLGYEQNTEELFELFDAWETLNMTQMEYLQQLQDLLSMQAELERILQQK